MARNAPFTPASIDALSKGKLHDPRTPGLAIEVLPSGKKVWKCVSYGIGVAVLGMLVLGDFIAERKGIWRQKYKLHQTPRAEAKPKP